MPLTLSGTGGITYPDGSVNTTRSVSTAGDTMTGILNLTGLNASQSITVGSDGAYTAGSIYSDVNWGMILRARRANPVTADFSLRNSADVERMRIDFAGRMTVPGQPAFCATAAYGSAHVGNLTPIVFANIDINRGNHYNTSNGIFTAPIAGAYYFITQAHLGNNTGYATIRILQNAGVVSNSWSGNTADSGWNSLSASVILNLAANDTVSVQMETSKPTNYIAETYWKFMGYLIG
jgi:hypothetical protein